MPDGNYNNDITRASFRIHGCLWFCEHPQTECIKNQRNLKTKHKPNSDRDYQALLL